MPNPSKQKSIENSFKLAMLARTLDTEGHHQWRKEGPMPVTLPDFSNSVSSQPNSEAAGRTPFFPTAMQYVLTQLNYSPSATKQLNNYAYSSQGQQAQQNIQRFIQYLQTPQGQQALQNIQQQKTINPTHDVSSNNALNLTLSSLDLLFQQFMSNQAAIEAAEDEVYFEEQQAENDHQAALDAEPINAMPIQEAVLATDIEHLPLAEAVSDESAFNMSSILKTDLVMEASTYTIPEEEMTAALDHVKSFAAEPNTSAETVQSKIAGELMEQAPSNDEGFSSNFVATAKAAQAFIADPEAFMNSATEAENLSQTAAAAPTPTPSGAG